jgi:light-regulated signal transduction histidine kinase (bacteriophytochrome)
MALLIDDLLTLSKVTRVEMAREHVDLTALAERVVERLRKSDPLRAVDLIIGDDLAAMADPQLVAVVVENLLGNAWKFTNTRNAARIEIGRRIVDGAPCFFVEDNGAGFDMQYANKLFGVFQRLHLAEQFEGTGIGLATVQRIIHRHGGQVRAEGAVDQGATFYFSLPKAHDLVERTASTP